MFSVYAHWITKSLTASELVGEDWDAALLSEDSTIEDLGKFHERIRYYMSLVTMRSRDFEFEAEVLMATCRARIQASIEKQNNTTSRP